MSQDSLSKNNFKFSISFIKTFLLWLQAILDNKFHARINARGRNNLLRHIRTSKLFTAIIGPINETDPNKIEIDITYKCNLKCFNCDRSCRQAPSEEYMSIGQIEKFVRESIEQKRSWKQIRVLGGEPTLHLQFFDIVQLLLEYKKNFSPDTSIAVATNGFGPEVNYVLRKIPYGVLIYNTRKVSAFQHFDPFNIAPTDSVIYKYTDFGNACWVTPYCGIGLTRYGYYPCAVSGSIDRVFGFDIGRKKMPSGNDPMVDAKRILCKYCGHFIYNLERNITEEKISSSWKQAYEKYKIIKPFLQPY